MNLPDTKNKKTIVENDSLEKLEHDVKSALNKMGTHGVSDAKYEPSYFDARYRVLEKQLKGRQKDIAEIFEQRLEQLKTCLKKESYLVKHIIFWNLLAWFLYWVEVDISSEISSAILGIAITGLEKKDVVAGFYIWLLFLYAKLLWIIIKPGIVIANFRTLCRILEKRENNLYRIYQLIGCFAKKQPLNIDHNAVNPLSSSGTYDLRLAMFDDSLLVELVERYFCLLLAILVPILTLVVAGAYIIDKFVSGIDPDVVFKRAILAIAIVLIIMLIMLIILLVKRVGRQWKND